MASEAAGSTNFLQKLLLSAIKPRRSVRMLEDSEQETFGVTSALFGPDFALQACANPSLLQKGQRVLDGFLGHINSYVQSLNNKLQFTVSLAKGLQHARFHTKVDTPAQLLLSRTTEQRLRSDLRAERYRQGVQPQSLYYVASIRETFETAEAQNNLQAILNASTGDASRLAAILESFVYVMGDNDCVSGAVNLQALIAHPALEAAFKALTASDTFILDAAVAAIQAAVNVSSSAGETAELEGAWDLATYLFEKASDLAQQMSKYGKEAAQGDFSNHNKAAALAKVLASVTMANMIPVSGLLADEESQPLLRAMAAIRSYPAAGVASEAALFWRILHESNDMAAAWARDLRLNDASNLTGLIEDCYVDLLHKLYSSAVLPEKHWGQMSTGQQAMLLEQRKAIAEPLLEAVGVLGFRTCMEELFEASQGHKGKWTPQEALLACANMLHRADPPIAQFKLIWIFERLSYLPRMGALTATALDSIALYGRWVYATAEVAPTEAENMVDQFNIVWNSEEAMALRSRAQETQKARSEASEELRSETTSDYNDTESQASEPSASTADISDADDHLESERVTAEAVAPTCLPRQSVPAGTNQSAPSRAPRGPPPGFTRCVSQVTPASSKDSSPTTPASQPAGASQSRPGGAPHAPPPGFERHPQQVTPASSKDSSPTPPASQPAPMGTNRSRPGGAPRAAPPGFEGPARQAAPAAAATSLKPPASQPAPAGASQSRLGGAPRGAPPGFQCHPQQATPTTRATHPPTPASQPAPAGASQSRPGGAPRGAPPGFQRPACEAEPVVCQESVPSPTDSSAAAAVSASGAVPEPTAQNASEAEISLPEPEAEFSEQAVTVQQDVPTQVESDAAAPGAVVTGESPPEPANSSPAESAPGAEQDSTPQSASEAESDILSTEQAVSDTEHQDARAHVDSSAAASSTSLPGTLVGKMFYAAGALVGTVQGCARLFI